MQFSLPESILEQCRLVLGADIPEVRPIPGGDINAACLLDTVQGRFFLKMKAAPFAAQMFEAEAKGLQLLGQTGALRIPQVLAHSETPDGAFLLLEFIETGYRLPGFWEKFGVALAELHRQTAPVFGLEHDNFIGSLPQQNCACDTWAEFYFSQRLQPQLALALQAHRLQSADAQSFEKLFQKIPDLCPAEPPALTHGDLWSGNFLVSSAGGPVLIDPAVSFAHREMDLAMSRLFGGFERPFYRAYEEAFPLSPGFEQRLPVYQLYYLIVHVNLFGGGYVGSVRKILNDFV